MNAVDRAFTQWLQSLGEADNCDTRKSTARTAFEAGYTAGRADGYKAGMRDYMHRDITGEVGAIPGYE